MPFSIKALLSGGARIVTKSGFEEHGGPQRKQKMAKYNQKQKEQKSTQITREEQNINKTNFTQNSNKKNKKLAEQR